MLATCVGVLMYALVKHCRKDVGIHTINMGSVFIIVHVCSACITQMGETAAIKLN